MTVSSLSTEPFALFSLTESLSRFSLVILTVVSILTVFILSVLVNVLRQILFKNPHKPPVVFHWIPFVGSTITYGVEPFKFFERCRKEYGDIFTFILLGKPTTVYLGARGNNFILNGRSNDLSAEDVYAPLTTPVFGSDVVFDCPNAKLMEQKKFIKFGLTSNALRSYVRLINAEVQSFITTHPSLLQQGSSSGRLDVPSAMAELTIYTASRSLQGKEIRERLDSTFAELFHDLDMGFSPINFMLPWAPLPHNRKRDHAQRKMTQIYLDIIRQRRQQLQQKQHTEKESLKEEEETEEDMIWNLMKCSYKNGTPVPDKEIAHMMIALLMGGHHSSSSTISFIILRLASQPDITEELYQEQSSILGPNSSPDSKGKSNSKSKATTLKPLTYETLEKMTLHHHVVKETLRLHNPVHSIMRQVKNPLVVEGTPYIIPPSHIVLATPATSARDASYFPNPMKWDPHRWDTPNSNIIIKEADDNDDDIEDEATTTTTKPTTAATVPRISRGAESPYLPFGGGRHRCIGERFAYLQLIVILAALVREFRFYNIDGMSEVAETDFSSLFSRPMAPAQVKWERRKGLYMS